MSFRLNFLDWDFKLSVVGGLCVQNVVPQGLLYFVLEDVPVHMHPLQHRPIMGGALYFLSQNFLLIIYKKHNFKKNNFIFIFIRGGVNKV